MREYTTYLCNWIKISEYETDTVILLLHLYEIGCIKINSKIDRDTV